MEDEIPRPRECPPEGPLSPWLAAGTAAPRCGGGAKDWGRDQESTVALIFRGIECSIFNEVSNLSIRCKHFGVAGESYVVAKRKLSNIKN